jgi:hypothetical protein
MAVAFCVSARDDEAKPVNQGAPLASSHLAMIASASSISSKRIKK